MSCRAVDSLPCRRRFSLTPTNASRSLPLAVAHEAVALYEMQMPLSRLTSAIFISLGKALARGCDLSRVFWFH